MLYTSSLVNAIRCIASADAHQETCNTGTTLRDVDPTKTTGHPSTTVTKNAERREKFKAIGQALTRLTDNELAWRDRLGDHAFEIHGRPAQDHSLTSRLGNGRERGTRGPSLKTTQFERAIRRK